MHAHTSSPVVCVSSAEVVSGRGGERIGCVEQSTAVNSGSVKRQQSRASTGGIAVECTEQHYLYARPCPYPCAASGKSPKALQQYLNHHLCGEIAANNFIRNESQRTDSYFFLGVHFPIALPNRDVRAHWLRHASFLRVYIGEEKEILFSPRHGRNDQLTAKEV